jgi:2',3'-cyclic-nucleotide 2'-phosphodiesterase (5'-nucleotidase family)
LARRATAIAQLKEQNEHVLLLDSGESLFRGGYSIESDNPKQGALIVAAMNALGYDAMALGERDLGAPLSTVQARLEEAGFPILSANVRSSVVEGKEALPNVQPYLLYNVGGHTVAIVGATSETAGQRLEALGLDVPQDVLAAVGQAVKEAQRRADVVVVLSNLEQSEVEALAQTIPGIDVIIGVYRGGQLAPIALPGAEGQVVFQASGRQGERLGVLTLHLDARGQVTSFEGRPLTLTDAYADDPEILQLIREYASDP